MKHLKKFNESLESDKLDILENFIHISDKFGDPHVTSTKYGNDTKWILSWSIKIDVSVLQEAEKLINKLKDIVIDIDDVLSAGDRLKKYNINMSLTNTLRIELVPKDTGNDNFNFIKGYEWRQLLVNINEVERFFNSRGLRIVKWDNEYSYNQYTETNDLKIVLNKRDDVVTSEFHDLIMIELDKEHREYEVIIDENNIIISPLEEKSYIEVVLN
jgi:hypothetical protein